MVYAMLDPEGHDFAILNRQMTWNFFSLGANIFYK